MRAVALFPAGLLASALVLLVGCGGDQQATTAPSTTPSFAFKPRTNYTLSVICSGGVGTGTGAQVTLSSSGNASTTYQLACGDQVFGLQDFISLGYDITLTDGSNQFLTSCSNTKPIRNPGSFTCTSGQYSASLIVATG